MIRQHRAEEVEAIVSAHQAAGGEALFVTFTSRHRRGDPLRDRLKVVSEALRRCLDGSAWKRRRDRLGYVGSIKAVEVTWGEANGWHPHAHVLLLFERPVSVEDRDAFELWLWNRWAGVLEREGLGRINGHGLDVRTVSNGSDLGAYMAKVEGGWSVGQEVARGDRKSSAPVQLLAWLVETGEARAAALWCEYERATFGMRAIVFSRGLRARYLGSDEGLSDEEAASAEGANLTLVRALIDGRTWNRAVGRGEQGEMLTAIEQTAAVLLLLCRCWGREPQPLDR